MRRVPEYAIIGNGAMATHLCFYFDYLSIRYRLWCRAEHTLSQLKNILATATHALLLISDSAIEPFIAQHILDKHPHLICVHFSGCLCTTLAHSAHPLQTFSQKQSYTLDEYRQVPFVIDNQAPCFSQLLPGLDNPHYGLAEQDKAYYHAMCVLANNVGTLLWQKFYQEMTARFHIKAADLEPFLRRTFQNILANPQSALSGPIARRDTQTLQRNLDALQGDPFYAVMKAIVDQFAQEEILSD